MSNSERLISRFLGVQEGMRDLMVLCRRLRTDERETLPDTLKLIEDGIFKMGAELIAIPTELLAREEFVDNEITELAAISNRMMAEVDRQMQKSAPTEVFTTERHEVTVDADAGTVSVRERSDDRFKGPVYVPENGRAVAYLDDMAKPGSRVVVPFTGTRRERQAGKPEDVA